MVASAQTSAANGLFGWRRDRLVVTFTSHHRRHVDIRCASDVGDRQRVHSEETDENCRHREKPERDTLPPMEE